MSIAIFPQVRIPQGWRLGVGQFWGALTSESRMQVRRWSLWIIFGGIALIQAILLWISVVSDPISSPSELIRVHVHNQMEFLDWLLPLVVGLLTADRLPRERSLRINELIMSTIPGPGWYVSGKYCANALVIGGYTLLAVLLDGMVQITAGVPPVILFSLLIAFWIVLAPVLLLVIAFVFLLSCYFPTRITQILFPIIWLYSTLTGLGPITPANTIFAPDGRYALEGFWGINQALGIPTYTHKEILINIFLLLSLTLLCLFLTSRLIFAFAGSQRLKKQLTSNFRWLKNSRKTSREANRQRFEQRITLYIYHIRVSQPFLLLYLLIGLLLFSALIIITRSNGDIGHSRAFACYALELGVPLLAGLLGSSAVMDDKAKELLICNRYGIKMILWIRMMLFFIMLACTASIFLLISEVLHIQYTQHDTPALLLSIWLVPLFLAGMVGMLGALLTRSSTLGSTIASVFVLLPHVAYFFTLNFPIFRLFLIPLALFYPETNIWWANRLILLAFGILCMILALYSMRKDEQVIEIRV